jgi:hypothetical protein
MRIKTNRDGKISLNADSRVRIWKMRVFKRERVLEKEIKRKTLDSGHIIFASKSGCHEGKLREYSRFGLFVETGASLSVGEVVTIALPYMKSRNIICKGQIARSDRAEMGIELLRGSSPVNLKI